MKNVHLIPTDKPSRLWTNNLKRRLELDEFPSQHPINVAKNIYITSEEEIKYGDWFISKEGIIHNNFGWNFGDIKIILTTDQDLIADGIQPIDDEFLEWFVKNPSCEEVDVYEANGRLFADPIISQEEPNFNMKDEIEWVSNNPQCKQIGSCYSSLSKKCICPQEEAKQETPEEAAAKYAESELENRGTFDDKVICSIDFIAGAKWQEKRMFELMDSYVDDVMGGCNLRAKEWFNQNKK